jgi:hypothetical protein
MLKFVHILILHLSLACFASINQIQTWNIEKLLRKFYTIYKELKTIYLLSESRITLGLLVILILTFLVALTVRNSY